MKIQQLFLVIAFSAFVSPLMAQTENNGFDWGATEKADTTTTDSSSAPEEVKPAENVVKPYERISLYVDSITNLISYLGVVEQEESSSDSLYIRAKKWITNTFGQNVKYETDKKAQKIIVSLSIPAYLYTNKYGKRLNGKYDFKLTLWIKEGRYKYLYSNFVHEATKPATGNAMRNYFEFYYTTQNNIKNSDMLLRFADKDINTMIEKMKRALSDPLDIDEDDW
jgi:hypothetical protein